MSRKKKAEAAENRAATHRKTQEPAESEHGTELKHDAGTNPLEREAFVTQEMAQEQQDTESEQAEPTELEQLRAQLAEEHDRLLRAIAEIDNLRKRSRREVADARRFAKADVLRSLLEVLDNFERALQHTGTDAAVTEPSMYDGCNSDPDMTDLAGKSPAVDPAQDSFRQGIVLIAQSFRQVMHDCGVRRIDAIGCPFDPALHEAVGQAPADEGTASGTVVSELQAGYIFDDLVLRASRVIVAQ